MIFSLFLCLIRYTVDYVSLVQSYMQLFILQCEKGNNTGLILTTILSCQVFSVYFFLDLELFFCESFLYSAIFEDYIFLY